MAGLKEIEELGDISFKEKAKKLFVRYVATGTLWKMDDMFQLSIELYDTKDKKVIWSDRWQENWDNLPTIKGKLSDGLLKALDTTPREKQLETNNPKAYEFYLKGFEILKGRKNIDDFHLAKGLIEQSIKLDNDFYPAQILLNNIYQKEGNLDEAEKILNKLIDRSKLDKNKRALAEGYLSYANIIRLKADI